MRVRPAVETEIFLDTSDVPPDLLPGEAVTASLREGRVLQQQGVHDQAAEIYTRTVDLARQSGDSAGEARSLAQLAALQEANGQLVEGLQNNRLASSLFLEIGDGAGLVQSYRLDGFLALRQGRIEDASIAFARALALALQLDTRLVLMTIHQFLPAARFLIEAGELAALLPLGAALSQAVDGVEEQRGSWPDEMAAVAEIARTAAQIFPPLALMATEPDLTPEKRRALAARATHQAWMVDALTRRRWNLADLVDETLKTKLDYHEKLD
jgi:tetratricopeptide (TPR) repeat protein